MKFDVFHSLGRVDAIANPVSDRQSFENFFAQSQLAEDLGFGTVWVAESHFSSEAQKQNSQPVIPNYVGEVGLNSDSMILSQALFARTKRIGFGTAIMNILGGNGGPIASANRIRTLAWHNLLRDDPRPLNIGVAAGRFPYINQPFGIQPRDHEEQVLWPIYKGMIFAEALEVFLRLSRNETITSESISSRRITQDQFRDEESWLKAVGELGDPGADGWSYKPRYEFEHLKLVPDLPPDQFHRHLRFVLGSSDPEARRVGLEFGDPDIFNLSFTPPDVLNRMHADLTEEYQNAGKSWSRSRMPRTVLVFIDQVHEKAQKHAEDCFDTYIEAMRGTVKMPPREKLMERALIGTPDSVHAQLAPGGDFDADDRLMLWFEFNQGDNSAICQQMKLFAEKVFPDYLEQP